MPLTIARFGERQVTTKREVVRANNGETPHQKVWRVLGLRLENLGKQQLPSGFQNHYQGGLRVVEGRNDGPAAAKGLSTGDRGVGVGPTKGFRCEAPTKESFCKRIPLGAPRRDSHCGAHTNGFVVVGPTKESLCVTFVE